MQWSAVVNYANATPLRYGLYQKVTVIVRDIGLKPARLCKLISGRIYYLGDFTALVHLTTDNTDFH